MKIRVLAPARALIGAFIAALVMVAGCDLAPNQGRQTQSRGEPVNPQVVAARGTLAESEQATIAIFRSASPSVVLVISGSPGGAFAQGQVAAGTGFVWDREGHIVTNNHVVADAAQIVVRAGGGHDDIPATLVGAAPNFDLAVLRLQRPINAPPLAIGTSHDLQVGQATFAIGNPFGFDQTLTSGIVSAIGRQLPTNGGREIADVIQTDAAINPGNSGGPLLDSAGRVIGVTTAIYSPSGAYAGVGFAIPVDTVMRIVPALIRDGRAPVAGIGIVAADQSIATRLGVDGVLVWETTDNSPAARAGLRPTDPGHGVLGDVIVQAQGQPVHRLADLTNALDRVGVGGRVALLIQRGDGRVEVTVPVQDIGANSAAGK
jgi:2-alkenal reductase